MAPARHFAQPYKRSGRCRWPGRSTPTARCWRERAGFRALYLSGAGVANASFGLPDLGMTTLNDVCEDVRRISAATRAAAAGGRRHGLGRGVQHRAHGARADRGPGAAGMHLEDQVQAKRCGHRPGKALVAAGEMVRPHQGGGGCAHGRDRSSIMARTDAHAVEGLERGDRARAARTSTAGADMIFAEALTTLDEYRAVHRARCSVPVLANITEFGKTPLFTVRRAGAARACGWCCTRCRRFAR